MMNTVDPMFVAQIKMMVRRKTNMLQIKHQTHVKSKGMPKRLSFRLNDLVGMLWNITLVHYCYYYTIRYM